MAINKTKAGLITPIGGRTTTGRDYLDLPDVSCLTILYIFISGGSAEIDIEVSDDPDHLKFFPIETITESTVLRVSMPSSVVACNVTSLSGANVEVRYRLLVLDNVPDYAIDTFEEGNIRARRFIITAPVEVEAEFGNPSRFQGPAHPATSNATIYTVPINSVATIKTIHACNVTASPATLTLSFNSDADSNMWMKTFTIPAFSTYDWTGEYVLNAGDTVQALQGTADAITLTISGNLKDLSS